MKVDNYVDTIKNSLAKRLGKWAPLYSEPMRTSSILYVIWNDILCMNATVTFTTYTCYGAINYKKDTHRVDTIVALQHARLQNTTRW